MDVALVVEPDADLEAALTRALAARYRTVIRAVAPERAVERLLDNDHIALVVIDVEAVPLGVDVACAAVLKLPTPIVVATHAGGVAAADAFKLSKSGVQILLHKPFTTDELLRTLDDTLAAPPPMIFPWVAPFVGRMALFDFETDVRRALVLQALLKTDESRSAAARLLRAPRPVIQRAAPPKTRPRKRRR